MPCSCKITTTFIDGKLRKSPPIEKLLRNYAFKERYCTLGLVDICLSCGKGMGNQGTKLVFSYYKDETEQTLKGRFEVENSKLKRVDEIKECPRIYQNEKYILKWTLAKYDRKLYLLLNDEDEIAKWLNVFKDYKENRRRSRSRQSSDTSETSETSSLPSSRCSSDSSREI